MSGVAAVQSSYRCCGGCGDSCDAAYCRRCLAYHNLISAFDRRKIGVNYGQLRSALDYFAQERARRRPPMQDRVTRLERRTRHLEYGYSVLDELQSPMEDIDVRRLLRRAIELEDAHRQLLDRIRHEDREREEECPADGLH